MIRAFTFESCHTIPAFLQSPNLISKFKSTVPFPFHSLSDFGSGSVCLCLAFTISHYSMAVRDTFSQMVNMVGDGDDYFRHLLPDVTC
ncbi:hypothetical protein HanIR_Chr14g0690391 [Helianthus annuus]|nr:hypothetical protein HanIR_Chr14g0690391 [Helianthus annuus]